MICAEELKSRFPKIKYSREGYSNASEDYISIYAHLVDITITSCIYGPIEIHTCKCCKKQVYNKIHK